MGESIMDFDKLAETTDDNLQTIIGMALGRASVCWSDMAGSGVFESDDAKKILDEVIEWIEERYEPKTVKASTDERPFSEVPNSQILRYFVFDHLPEKLREVSRSFAVLAWEMEGTLPPGPERTVTLRKLLEAKDAAVRAALDT